MEEMHLMASPHGGEWAALRSRLPDDLDLAALGRETRAFLQPRGVRDAESLLRLALARGPGGLSVDGTAAWARAADIAHLTGPSLHDRLHQSVAFLQAIVAHLLRGRMATGSPLWWGRHLRLSDSTSLSQPGSTGTNWRIHAVYDLARGGFVHLDLTDGRGGEGLCRGEAVGGEVRIADRGFCNGPELARFLDRQPAEGADFIVRLRWSTLRLQNGGGQPFDLIGFLQGIEAAGETRGARVRFLPAKGRPTRPLRLVALRLPDAQAEANRKQVLQRASRLQRKTDPRSLVAAGYVLLGTTLPEDIPAAEILAVYRLRWQIELAFKRLKSLLHIDRLPTKTPKGGQSWLYAHLILALLCEDMTQEFLESFPSGLV
jgi:hypothetical protein